MPVPLYVVDENGDTKAWDGIVKFPSEEIKIPSPGNLGKWSLLLGIVQIILLLAILVSLWVR